MGRARRAWASSFASRRESGLLCGLLARGADAAAMEAMVEVRNPRLVVVAQFSARRRSAVSSSVVMWVRYCVVDHP